MIEWPLTILWHRTILLFSPSCWKVFSVQIIKESIVIVMPSLVTTLAANYFWCALFVIAKEYEHQSIQMMGLYSSAEHCEILWHDYKNKWCQVYDSSVSHSCNKQSMTQWSIVHYILIWFPLVDISSIVWIHRRSNNPGWTVLRIYKAGPCTKDWDFYVGDQCHCFCSNRFLYG